MVEEKYDTAGPHVREALVTEHRIGSREPEPYCDDPGGERRPRKRRDDPTSDRHLTHLSSLCRSPLPRRQHRRWAAGMMV
jgi:hypothetical protein